MHSFNIRSFVRPPMYRAPLKALESIGGPDRSPAFQKVHPSGKHHGLSEMLCHKYKLTMEMRRTKDSVFLTLWLRSWSLMVRLPDISISARLHP